MKNDRRKQRYPYPENLALDILNLESPEELWNAAIPEGLQDAVEYAMQPLQERERAVLISRYAEHKTLAETGETFGICRDRIRQIEVKSLRKLRHWYPKECRLFTAGIDGYNQYLAEKMLKEEKKKDPSGNMLIDDIGLSLRLTTRLKLAGYRYASEVAGKSRMDLVRVKGLGKKTYSELQEGLKKAGF